MLTTSISLLARLGQPNQNAAWDRFVRLYAPFLSHILINHLQIQEQDAADVVQEIFVTLLRILPRFAFDPKKGNFRGYLRRMCVSKAADLRRKRRGASEAEFSGYEDKKAQAEVARVWEQDHNRFLARRALELMQEEFQPTTWKACWEFVVHGRSAADVAAELGISENAVSIAKYRVIQRLRQDLDGMLED